MTQQYITDRATAEGCLPTWRHWMPSDGVEGEMIPPTVKHLPGPIECDGCTAYGCDPDQCSVCDGRGYPPELEIVSPSPVDPAVVRMMSDAIVRGVVTVGPPETINDDPSANDHDIGKPITVRHPITPKETT
jgi:hypothetical protein